MPKSSMPESFKVLIHEIKALALDIEVKIGDEIKSI